MLPERQGTSARREKRAPDPHPALQEGLLTRMTSIKHLMHREVPKAIQQGCPLRRPS